MIRLTRHHSGGGTSPWWVNPDHIVELDRGTDGGTSVLTSASAVTSVTEEPDDIVTAITKYRIDLGQAVRQ